MTSDQVPSADIHESGSFARQLNQTGYPLQIAIENLVRDQLTFGPGEWRVRFKEHAWQSEDGEDFGFIDLVLENQAGIVVFVLECKRFREATWLFLAGNGTKNNTARAKIWATMPPGPATQGGPLVLRDGVYVVERQPSFYGWFELNCQPLSPEMEFCVSSAKEKKEGLEQIGSGLISATEALAGEELPILLKHSAPPPRIYIPVIVTTVELRVCEFDPNSISLETGDLPNTIAHSSVPVIRFRKQLSTKHDEIIAQIHENALITREKERTVFVVQAKRFADFLASFSSDRPNI